MAITLVNFWHANSGTTTTTVTVSTGGLGSGGNNPPNAGNTLIVGAASGGTALTSYAISDSASDTYNVDVALGNHGSGNAWLTIAHIDNIPSGLTSVTGTTNVGAQKTVFVAEYSGLLKTGSLDGTPPAIKGANSTSLSTNSATPSVTGGLAFALFGDNVTSANTLSTWGGGFTSEDTVNAPGGTTITSGWGDQSISSLSALSATATLSAGTVWSGAISLYLPDTGLMAQIIF